MSLVNADRLDRCAERMRWFAQNERDIRKDTFMPYLLAVDVLVKKMEDINDIPDNLIKALENILKKAEQACQPEDAHAFVYDKNFKLWD